MGKTSTALHVLHYPDIVTRYRDRRYFVGCDAVTSAEALAALILQIIRVTSTGGEDVVTVLHRALVSAPLTLLLLDNFETAWDTNSRRDGVVDLLQKVANAKNVSLIITMRGTVPPSGIAWTRFVCLPQLSPPDARRSFLAINPSWNNGERTDEECLDTLLAEMDHVPLAVQLLAHVSIGFSPLYMLKRWTEKKTAMLRIHEGTPGKLESVEVSIELSLAAFDVKSNPEAVQLLGILCQLPDGLHEWEERLPIVASRLHDVHRLVHLLHKTALVFIAGSVLKVLSPIRHFINRHHDVDPDHIRALENYFWGMVHTHATVSMGPSFPRAKEILEPDMGNIRSLIKSAAQTHPSPELVEIVLAISHFQYFTVPSTELLRDVMPLVKHLQSPTQEARILRRLGNILRMQAKYTEAIETLTEARRQFIEIGDVVGAAKCSKNLGNILRMQAKYTQASEILTEAQRQFIEIGDVLSVAQCSRSLGDILHVQAKYTEAFETLTEAQRQFIKIGDILGAAKCLEGLGNILCTQAKYTEASEILTEAQGHFVNIGDVFGVAQCSHSLGDILRLQAKYTEASEILTEAQGQFVNIGNVFGAAFCSMSLGDILCMQGKYSEASETLVDAQRQLLDIGDARGVAHCSKYLGNTLYQLGKYPKAFEALTEVRQEFLNIGAVLDAHDCSRRLGDILIMQNKFAEAFDTLTEAQQQFLDIGYPLGVTQCSQSLGKILFMQHKYTESSEILTEAQRQFISYDNAVSAAECSTILDAIYRAQADSVLSTLWRLCRAI
jgi:tetratricopeptide (TPR) repeat protein